MPDILNAPVRLSTARLLLRKPKLSDARPLFREYAADAEVVRFLSWKVHRCEQETMDFLQQCLHAWTEGTIYAYVIELLEEPDLPIGMIDIRPRSQRVDYGYVLSRRYWGHGYMSEALSCLVEWSLDQPGVWRASAFCDWENHASARVMEKAGMTFEGVLRRYSVMPNASSEPRDCRMYAKVRT